MIERPWAAGVSDLAREYHTDIHLGLTTQEARRRLINHGPNELKAKNKVSGWTVFLRQLQSPLIYILIIAGLFSLYQGDFSDSIIIFAIVVLNSVVGFFQEYKAEKAMAKLRQILSPRGRLIRDGVEQKTLARLLVPGDVVLLEAGDRIPADMRLVECQNLTINQAILTGESVSVGKSTSQLPEKTALINRDNMVYMGTLAVAGQAVGIVTATGMKTELGQIAGQTFELGDVQEGLSKKIASLSKFLLVISVVLCAVALTAGLIRGIEVSEMIKTAISLLISIVPESLPMAVTVTLSVGLLRVFRNKAVIRRLVAAETLGSMTTVCVDKTGTITEGKIMVEKLFVSGQEYRVTGQGHRLSGEFYLEEKKVNPNSVESVKKFLELTSLATMSTISEQDMRNDRARELTDPTETAMAVVAAKAGFYAFKREKIYPELLEIPFDQELRLSASIHRIGRINRYIVKGSPEKILGMSKNSLVSSGVAKGLHNTSKHELLHKAEGYAREGYRVTALGYVDYPASLPLKPDKIKNLTFAGFLIMADPIRAEARQAIETAQAAGIRVIMITGDHLLTAESIGQQVGLMKYGVAIHADDVSKKNLSEVSVIARATPTQKLMIVERLQKLGHIVGMTGDGVNDAPALKRSDVGIAMGRGGSDVAIEAADMVLLNDNFTGIIAAVEQGRLIWENLRKVSLYLISTAFAEVIMITTALIIGLPLPLVAVQILWLNLVTDGFNSMSLTVEPNERDLMKSPPRHPDEPIFNGLMLFRVALHSTIMAVVTLLAYNLTLDRGVDYARTMALVVMIVFHFYNLINCRSATRSIFTMRFNNPLLFIMLALSILLTLTAVFVPLVENVLHTTDLSLQDFLLSLVLPTTIIVADEVLKAAVRLVNAWSSTQKTFS